MEESNNNQRLLIATLLCFAVLAVWQFFLAPKKTKRPPAQHAQVQTATAAHPAQAGLPETVSSTQAPMGTRVVAPELFHFKGAVPNPTAKGQFEYELTLTNVGGGIEHFVLPTFKERDKSNEKTDRPITLAEPASDKPDLAGQVAGVAFAEGTTFQFPVRPIYEVVEKKDDSIRYRFTTPQGIVIEREYTLKHDSFEIELAVTVRNGSQQPQSHRLQLGTALPLTEATSGGGFLFMPPPDHLQGVCFTEGKVKRDSQANLKKTAVSYKNAVKWAGIDRQYFIGAFIQRDGVEPECRMSGVDQEARVAMVMPLVSLKPGEEKRHKFTAYLGVKKPELMTRVDSQLEAGIDYTILGLDLTLLCNLLLWVLSHIKIVTGSWGVAILGLTLLVKSLLFPLNQRSGKSMRAMSALRPEIEALKTKYPDDRQRQGEEMMKLYKKHNVNPAGGCLPVLLQMPIWFALYRSLWVSVDLYQESFLWIPDLTARDPFWILPVTLTVVMFIQQKMTPTTMDPAQQKIMLYTMPLLFGFMMSALPAGLSFYILVNTLLTIVQQHFINKSVGPMGGPPSAQGAPA